jgi:hypothetical protein
MPNMRVISTNLTDITSTLTVNTETAGFPIANVKTDYKSTFHRTTGLSAVYTLNWGTVQSIGGVCLPCTNLSSAANIQVQLYSDAGATLVANSGTIPACASSPIKSLTTSIPNGILFQLGVLSKTAVWFSSNIANVLRAVITVTDTSANTAGYVDCARIVCGSYWQPTYNASRAGLDITVSDSSQNSRTDAGDLVSDRGFVYDELSLNLGLLSDTDRNNLLQLTRTAGTNRNVLVSVFPTDYSASSNGLTEQQYTVYGKRANSAFNYTIQGFGSSTMQITGW